MLEMHYTLCYTNLKRIFKKRGVKYYNHTYNCLLIWKIIKWRLHVTNTNKSIKNYKLLKNGEFEKNSKMKYCDNKHRAANPFRKDIGF